MARARSLRGMTDPLSPPAILLSGLSVVNAGRGLVAALAGKLLQDLGAEVFRLGADGPDPAGMFHPAYEYLRSGEKALPREHLAAVLDDAELLIVGGEDFPDLSTDDAGLLACAPAHPSLVTLHITGYPACSPDSGNPAVDILVQARSGLTFEHYADRANLMAFQPTHYGAALQGLIGALAAIVAKRRGGVGQIVSTSLYEGALAWVTTWGKAETPTPAFRFTTPYDPQPLILRCADGDYIHIVLGSAGSKYNLYRILGIDDPTVKPGDSGLPNKDDPPERFYGDVDKIAPFVARWSRAELTGKLAEAGIVAASVLAPGTCWDDSQVLHDGLVRTLPDGAAIVAAPATISVPAAAVTARVWPENPAVRPLDGVRIVDFGAFTAGPLASLCLSRLGADVVKIEPLSGDPARNLPRAFMAANRGKRSIALDMKSQAGAMIAASLCAETDIVVSNFRSGVAAKLGIDAPRLIARHPHLIVLECPAFGSSGPRASEVAFDLVMQALCGFEVRAGGEGGVPLWNRTFLADYGGGQLGAITILAALLHRMQTGRGAAIEISLLRSALFLQSETVRYPDGAFHGAALLDHAQSGFSPAEALYRTADGWIAIAVRSAPAAAGLLELLKLDVSVDWRRWGDHERAGIADAMRSWGQERLLAALAAAGVWAAPCRAGMEAATLSDQALLDAGIIQRVPEAGLGEVAYIGTLARLSAAPRPAARPMPALGEHTDDILCAIGITDAEIAKLRASGTIL